MSASGDEGSEDCFAPPTGFPPSVPNLSLAVDDPGSQQFVTSVGGTTLSNPGPRPSETIWNNGAAAGLASSGGAGGGGVSEVWGMPGYQSGAAGPLNVAQSGSREVPDVSADADPNTGYMVYWNGSGADPLSTSGWQAIAGTSAAAPMWAALLAVINASSACHSSPIGFANPALYRAAGASYGSTFNDITSGNNDLFGANGGKYPAAGGFDMASGLGTPNGGGLASSLCAVALRVANPGPQRATVGKSASLQMRTVGTATGRISWRASGLPPGLSISTSTGRITGKPRRAGVYSVAVSGTDQGTPVGQAAFRWTVAGVPSVSRASITGVGSRRPALSLTIASGSHAAALKAVTITLPGGLRFMSKRGAVAISGARGKRVGFRSRIVRGRLQITLASPQTKIGLKLRISTTSALAGRVRSHRVRTLQVTVATTDAARQGSTARPRVRTA